MFKLGAFHSARMSRQLVPKGRNLHVMIEEDSRVDGRRDECLRRPTMDESDGTCSNRIDKWQSG